MVDTVPVIYKEDITEEVSKDSEHVVVFKITEEEEEKEKAVTMLLPHCDSNTEKVESLQTPKKMLLQKNYGTLNKIY